MHKIIKSLAFSSFISNDKIKWRLSHLCIHIFGGLFHYIMKLHKHSINSVSDEMKKLIFISKGNMTSMSRSQNSRTSMDQSDWQDESRNSGRQIKLSFIKKTWSFLTYPLCQSIKFYTLTCGYAYKAVCSFQLFRLKFCTHFSSPPVGLHNI